MTDKYPATTMAPAKCEARADLAGILAAVVKGLEESRRMLGTIEHTLLENLPPHPANGGLQDIDRISQRLCDLETLLSLLANCGTAAPPSAEALTSRLKLAEIRALIPGLPAPGMPQPGIINAAGPGISTDPILF